MRDFSRRGETFQFFNKQASYDAFELKEEDFMNQDEKTQTAFHESQNINVDGLDEFSSNRQHLIIDEDEAFKNLAATMRNPNVNKFNILDTIADYKMYNSKV